MSALLCSGNLHMQDLNVTFHKTGVIISISFNISIFCLPLENFIVKMLVCQILIWMFLSKSVVAKAGYISYAYYIHWFSTQIVWKQDAICGHLYCIYYISSLELMSVSQMTLVACDILGSKAQKLWGSGNLLFMMICFRLWIWPENLCSVYHWDLKRCAAGVVDASVCICFPWFLIFFRCIQTLQCMNTLHSRKKFVYWIICKSLLCQSSIIMIVNVRIWIELYSKPST